MAQKLIRLGPTNGVHLPTYGLQFFNDGDRRRPVTRVNWQSATAIQTSKSINDICGTFTITLKDRRARGRLREMDAGFIKFRGHYRPDLITALKVVVDEVRPAGSADVHAGSEDTVITGRCVGKYLMVTSLFLPVWDPEGLLPTALIFGMGDVTKKGTPSHQAGGITPFHINRYLIRKFTYGATKQLAGASGIPNARFWLDYKTRFAKKLGFDVPFIQYDEHTVADAFKRLEVLGFTEAWVDELGRQVYRRPAWDDPISYVINTGELLNWSFPRSDVDTATYVEVIPAGDPGIDTATAAALRAGRAPVPSAYLKSDDTSLASSVNPDFVIETDSKGRPTEKGRRNHWYRMQRRLGVRPQQISSPLIFTQEQAQAQAEGLLRFYGRATKGGTWTMPGAPEIRLGRNVRVYGDLDHERFDRVMYVEAVSHDYVEGEHFTTTVHATHGRDPWDPRWREMVLPRFDPDSLEEISDDGGVLPSSPAPNPDGDKTTPIRSVKGTPKYVIDTEVLPLARKILRVNVTPKSITEANARHNEYVVGTTRRSAHKGPPHLAWAADLSDNWSAHGTPAMDRLARALADKFRIPWSGSGVGNAAHGGYSYNMLYRTTIGGNHYNHVHFGVKKL